MSSLFSLHGKTALITGSTRGLGFAYAQGLAAAGASVIINGTQEIHLKNALEKLQNQGVNARGFLLNVADEAAVEALFTQLDAENVQVDIVINNAGIQFRKPMLELELSDWQHVLDINLTSAFLVARAAARRMVSRQSGGKIINIGSLTSQAARATVAPYTAAKGGIKLLTKSMAAEWAQYNIQSNAIGPGYILTDMNQALVENAEFDRWVRNSTPSGRWGAPEELIGTAVYLSSQASNYVNGQIIYVDGGWLATL
ncbi:gluconate 5-dehydrogenase [Mixta theicola]|uniref:Gluconate 5-dehydrogenase n=1 Tax=Mixta theicola TaxID=1458355 RepID=A0A2K1Q6L2_9GAMM|nr:SDR family oxidoreductase [Mixta theicola]PNS10651.1 gluconate 5-dehydrogenase [Mixta theicola]GLR10964.1 gluconate 5-dehydrogenase [Mixta theicola]